MTRFVRLLALGVLFAGFAAGCGEAEPSRPDQPPAMPNKGPEGTGTEGGTAAPGLPTDPDQ